jgi:thiol-disulfide isomerase/thioredoxin
MLSQEQNQLLDKYFSTEALTQEEQTQFDQECTDSKEFSEELEFRNSLKTNLLRSQTKNAANKEWSRLRTKKIFKASLLTIGLGAVLSLAYYYWSNSHLELFANEAGIETVEDIKSDNLTNLDIVEGEEYEYDADQTLVFESNNGTVVVVPKNAFVDASGKEVTEATVKLQEYLKPREIILAGLSTESNGEALETGGMFNITAKDKDGNILKLKEGKEILFEVPTANKKSGMMIFDSETDSVGNINWANPKPLDNYLTTVDINTLDFYPPKYLEELERIGLGNKSKAFKDSLFYTFYCRGEVKKPKNVDDIYFGEYNQFSNGERKDLDKGSHIVLLMSYTCGHCQQMYRDLLELKQELEGSLDRIFVIGYGSEFDEKSFWKSTSFEAPHIRIEDYDEYKRLIGKSTISKIIVKRHDVTVKTWGHDSYSKESMFSYFYGQLDTDSSVSLNCGITPAQIKTIWNKKFQNTYIATKEFEERLKVIYSTCNEEILKVYIQNLNKPMAYADKIAYEMSGNQKFKEFYARNTGTVKVKDEMLKELNTYYQKKSKVFDDLAKKSFEAYKNKNDDLDDLASDKAYKNSAEDSKRNYENYWSEFEHNLKKANSDLGTNYKYRKGVGVDFGSTSIAFVQPLQIQKYQFRVTSLGACNIDRFMKNVLETRTTQSFTENGKTTQFTFKDINVGLDSSAFDLVRVYFTSPTLYSFIKAKGSAGKYSYSINRSMHYDLVVVGQKAGKQYLYHQKDISDHLNLKTTDLKEVQSLSKALKELNLGADKGIEEDISYQSFLIKDKQRKQTYNKATLRRNELEHVIFPCNEADSIK